MSLDATTRDGQGSPATGPPPTAAFAAAILLALAACARGPSATPQRPAPPPAAPASAAASTAPAGGRPAPRSFLGVVIPRQSVEVAAESAGRLEAVDVRVGDRVVAGQRLARLDTRKLAQDLEIARAALRAARAEEAQKNVELAETEKRYQRRAALPESFSKEELAAADLERETARSSVAMSSAKTAEEATRVEQLASDLARADLRAPFAGTVALRYLDPGATVAAGTPVVRLIAESGYLVRFAVAPDEAAGFALGTPIEATEGDLHLRLPGTVSHVAPEIDDASQMVFIEADLHPTAEQTPRIRSGAVVRVLRASPPGDARGAYSDPGAASLRRAAARPIRLTSSAFFSSPG